MILEHYLSNLLRDLLDILDKPCNVVTSAKFLNKPIIASRRRETLFRDLAFFAKDVVFRLYVVIIVNF